MTREDFADWLRAHDCEQVVMDGINHTGRQLKFVNRKTNGYAYIDLPLDDRELPDYVIIHACKRLIIGHPDCVQDQEPLYDHLKTKYHKK
ncbi:MAG: hypothetical protein IAE95_02525 [Chitinophagaceae bacterium]|nr:hypothetical protein [Chitinophagaceae bacterium]